MKPKRTGTLHLALVVLGGLAFLSCDAAPDPMAPPSLEAELSLGRAGQAQGSVTLSPEAIEVEVGGEAALTGSIFSPAGKPVPGQSLTWSSEDPDIASVSASGRHSATVVGVAPGTTTVVATSTSGWSGSVPVAVAGAEPPEEPTGCSGAPVAAMDPVVMIEDVPQFIQLGASAGAGCDVHARMVLDLRDLLTGLRVGFVYQVDHDTLTGEPIKGEPFPLLSGTSRVLVTNPDRLIYMEPFQDYFGNAAFQYFIRDSRGVDSNTLQVGVTVVPVNDPPVATSKVHSITNDQGPQPLFLTYSDVDNHPSELTITIAELPDGGVLYQNGPDDNPGAMITGTENRTFPGSANGLIWWESDEIGAYGDGFATFSYTVTDPDGETAHADGVINIQRIYDFPVIVSPAPDFVIDVAEGETIQFDLEIEGEGYLNDGWILFTLGVDVLQPTYGAIAVPDSTPREQSLLEYMNTDYSGNTVVMPVLYRAPATGITEDVLEWRACFFLKDLQGEDVDDPCTAYRTIVFRIRLPD